MSNTEFEGAYKATHKWVDPGLKYRHYPLSSKLGSSWDKWAFGKGSELGWGSREEWEVDLGRAFWE